MYSQKSLSLRCAPHSFSTYPSLSFWVPFDAKQQIDAANYFARAYELSPNDLDILDDYARFIVTTGQHELAIRLARRSLDLDPTRREFLGFIIYLTGNLEDAAVAYQEAVALYPSDGDLRSRHGFIEALLGNDEQALAEWRIAETLSQDASFGGEEGLGYMAYGYSRLGRIGYTGGVFEKTEVTIGALARGLGMVMVLGHLAIEDHEGALEWLVAIAENPYPA